LRRHFKQRIPRSNFVKRDARIEWLLVAAMVAFGVLGRWLQPQWNVTPTAALALFAGFLFAKTRTAVLVPLAILAISNLLLDRYDHWGEMLAVYSAFLIPVALSSLVRRRFTAPRVALCSIASSTLFFLITNFAVWLYRRGDAYADSLAGLVACYEAGLLFFRWMLVGDLAYSVAIFGVYALAASPVFRRRVRVRVEK
jgi:hypothetical protein